MRRAQCICTHLESSFYVFYVVVARMSVYPLLRYAQISSSHDTAQSHVPASKPGQSICASTMQTDRSTKQEAHLVHILRTQAWIDPVGLCRCPGYDRSYCRRNEQNTMTKTQSDLVDATLHSLLTIKYTQQASHAQRAKRSVHAT